jgi:D-tyrosyl-tRNA(Tyr) deacylase
MRVLLQRVSHASVSVSGRELARIDKGLLLLVGVGAGDNDGVEERLAEKICNLRIFADAEHRMNLSVLDVGGEALVVSQFTLYGDVTKGRRPSWTDAAEPGLAAERVEAFAKAIEALGIRVGRGEFGAHMRVELENDGPVTMLLDSDAL